MPRLRLDDALARLRSAAAASRPFTVTLGPPTTFLPVNPVLYLCVRGEVDALHALRDRVFVEPLARTLIWPFQPHVTVVDGGEPERLEAAVTALAGYRAEVTFDRVHCSRRVGTRPGRASGDRSPTAGKNSGTEVSEVAALGRQ